MKEMMEKMKIMCKNMDKTNIPPFRNGLKMSNIEMMEKNIINGKGHFGSCKFFNKFMGEFGEK
jgi:hypothetical protein